MPPGASGVAGTLPGCCRRASAWMLPQGLHRVRSCQCPKVLASAPVPNHLPQGVERSGSKWSLILLVPKWPADSSARALQFLPRLLLHESSRLSKQGTPVASPTKASRKYPASVVRNTKKFWVYVYTYTYGLTNL